MYIIYYIIIKAYQLSMLTFFMSNSVKYKII